jgi:predicted metal-dependent hydrolase
LLDEQAAFREVVIVHELLHLLVPNHGKLFESLMNAYLPDRQCRIGGRANRICGQKQNSRSEGR